MGFWGFGVWGLGFGYIISFNQYDNENPLTKNINLAHKVYKTDYTEEIKNSADKFKGKNENLNKFLKKILYDNKVKESKNHYNNNIKLYEEYFSDNILLKKINGYESIDKDYLVSFFKIILIDLIFGYSHIKNYNKHKVLFVNIFSTIINIKVLNNDEKFKLVFELFLENFIKLKKYELKYEEDIVMINLIELVYQIGFGDLKINRNSEYLDQINKYIEQLNEEDKKYFNTKLNINYI